LPAFEFALPPGAKNIKIKTSTQEIAVEPTYYRHSKDGAIPIVALFGGDEFVGEVLEGQWLKDDDGSVQGPFTAKLNGSGSLELTGRSDAAGTARKGWIVSKHKIVLLDDLKLDIHLKLPSHTSSDEAVIIFGLVRDFPSGDPESESDLLLIYLKTTATTFYIRIRKKVNRAWTDVLSETVVTNQEGTVRFKFEESKSGHGHTHIYYHDGAGDVNEDQDELENSPFTLGLAFESAYPYYRFVISETTNRTVSSDFVRVTYPDFSVRYDLDDSDYQSGNRGEVIVWDTMGSDNEDDWVRVYDPSHKFVGDCVIENGLVRFKVELEDGDYPQWGYWNGNSWSMYNIAMPVGYMKAREFKLKVLTLEKVSVEFKSLLYYATNTLCGVEIRRGEPFVRVTVISGKGSNLYYYYPSCRFIYSQQSKITDDDLQTGWEAFERGTDNLVLRFSSAQQFFVSEFRERNEGSMEQCRSYGSALTIQIGETLCLGIVDFPKYANLFKEAEA